MPAKPDEQLPVSRGARELLPCPFGCEHKYVGHGKATSDGEQGFQVWCNWCGMVGPFALSEDLSFIAWDTRSGEREPAPSSERELLPALLFKAIAHVHANGGGVALPSAVDLMDPVHQSDLDRLHEYANDVATAYLASPPQEPALDLHTLEEARQQGQREGKADADAAVNKGPVNCTYIKRAHKQAYPRTCQRCGLGPCPFYQDDAASAPADVPRAHLEADHEGE